MPLILLGRWLGNRIANKTSLNLSWVGGVILIGLPVMRVFF